MEIAVFLDENNRTTSIYKCGIIKVYSNVGEEWSEKKQIQFGIDNSMDIKLIRENLYRLAEKLGECRIFVAFEVAGLLYTVLENIGFNIWEIEGTPNEFLDYVFTKEEEEEKSKDAKTDVFQAVPYPVQIGTDGCYSIDLKKIQQSDVNFTTKQILVPFLKKNTFYQLEIICSHIPNWFEKEFETLNLKQDIIYKEENEYKILVYKKTCLKDF